MFTTMMTDLLDMATATAWMADGLCSQADPDEWFPNPGQNAAAAKRVCGGCPVREQCLEYAIAEDIEFGVWGGLSAAERAEKQPLDLAA